MSLNRSIISPTNNPLLEQALRDKLKRRAEAAGSLGELEPLAVRLGLIQNSLKPRFRAPQIAVFAADHGLAVDGVGDTGTASTATRMRSTLPMRSANRPGNPSASPCTSRSASVLRGVILRRRSIAAASIWSKC